MSGGEGMAPGRRRFLQFNICGEKCAEQILLAGLTVQSARLTNLIQASLISVFFREREETKFSCVRCIFTIFDTAVQHI